MAFTPVIKQAVRNKGRLLLIDGDILAYDVSYMVEDDMVPAMKIKIDLKIKAALDDSGCEDYETYLTGSRNFRDGVAKVQQYKGNRYHPDGSRKTEQPKHLPTARAYIREYHDAIMREYDEADDGLSIRNWQIMTGCDLAYDEAVIASTDKDLRINPGLYMNLSTGEMIEHSGYGKVYVGPNGELKGHGLKFFLGQLLAGDRTDNIPGLLKVPLAVKEAYSVYRGGLGPTKAVTILHETTSYEQGLGRVAAAYADYFEEFCVGNTIATWDGYVISSSSYALLCEQGRLLWMRRAEGEMWTPDLRYDQYETELQELYEADKGGRNPGY